MFLNWPMNKRLEYVNTSQINLCQNKGYQVRVKTELSNEIHTVLPRLNSFVPRTESVLHTEQFSDVDNRPHFEHFLDSEWLGRVLKLLEIFNTEL